MELQDSEQEMAASPPTATSGKSKLDTLTREDLIKFAKKQMMLLQKVKSRSTELEKEIEKLKTTPVAGGTDDIIQALTEKLNVVLLEKAEAQQQCVALKKDNVKKQQEAEDALAQEETWQKKFAQLNTSHQKEIESLKNEGLIAQSKYNEIIATLQKELHTELKKQEQLTEQLNVHTDEHDEVRRLQEEVQQTKITYEEQILNLKKQIEFSNSSKEEEITKLKNTIESNSRQYQNRIDELGEELDKLKASHQDELSELLQKLEASAKVCEEEQIKVDKLKLDLIEQYKVKEKEMQVELQACKEKYEQELECIRQTLTKDDENQNASRNAETEPEIVEKTGHIEKAFKELESQHIILRDELTYMNNVKMKLELEVQHIKDEYFHEKEDLEFKINELHLAKEDHCCVIEKLKSELQSAKGFYEKNIKENGLKMENLIETHQKEICELKQAITSSAEKKTQSLLIKIQDLEEQCQRHIEEKEEAIASYENLRETLVTLQTELGESAGKISREFECMKQQQASDVDELQKKLRAAFNERDVLREEVNSLRQQVEQFSTQKEELEELRHKIGTLQGENDQLLCCLDQKESFLKQMEEKENELSSQNSSFRDKMQGSAEKIENLQKKCKTQQETVMALQQEVEALSICNHQLKQQAEELGERLEGVSGEKETNREKLIKFEQQMEGFEQERTGLLSEIEALKSENNKLKEEQDQARQELDRLSSEKGDWNLSKDKAESLEVKLHMACEEKSHLIKVLEEEKAFKSLVVSQLQSLHKKMGSKYPDENKEDIVGTLQAANEFLAEMKQEEQSLISQKNENINLRQELQRVQEENEARCTEFRSLLEDYEKEKCLLKEELEGAFSEKEVLQLDIQELKHTGEKIRKENQDLLVHIENISEQYANQENKMKEQEEKSEKEQKNLTLILEQKETELKNMQAELSLLKESVEKSSADHNQQLSETEKIVNLEQQLKEKEEKMNKIKAVAVKLRKELDSSRKEVQSLREELELIKSEKEQLSSSVADIIQGAESYKNLLLEYDKQAEQLDFQKTRARNFERQIDDLTKQLENSVQQQEQWHSANEDLLTRVETLQTNVKLLETQLLEIQKAKAKVDKELEAEKLLKEQKIKDHANSVREAEEFQTLLQKEKKQLQKVLDELELAKKDAHKSTLMDMEIADYERFVKELNQNITDKSSRIEDLKQEIKIQNQKKEILQEEIKSLQNSVQEYEEKNGKLKQLLVKTKKELADSKQAENELLRFQASLKGELEANKQQMEDYKIQLSELTSEKHKIQEHLRTSLEQHQRVLSTYQQKVAALQEECNAAKEEHSTVTSEFENYKVRVHNVLKQKNKSSQSETDVTKQEREHMEKVIEQLKIKLQETQHNLQTNVVDLQTLQSEHDALLDRHNKILQETVAKEAELREKLCTIQSENVVIKSEHAQTVSQLTAQNEALRNSFRDQIRHLQEEHRKTVETLQQQLSKVETQLFQLQSEPSTKNSAPSTLPTKSLRERRNTDLPLLDVHAVTREEGEGMETTDTESVSSASTYVPSLEQLLNTPEMKFEPPQWEAELTKQELVQKLSTTLKSADHLSGLLRESEATNVILMEQIKLLKSEIRRLERNQEREKSVANLEYLKNVLLQFIFLKSGSERQRLLPVIDTMLQLSPEEKGKLVAIAQGDEETLSQASGWASYLHSWSGLR
ncbi:GRIP and coiled-coil domain-containing protein 2 [Ahaetulla prasina]|uniref:GRIP and coiled-coil domain-containing protein 2 n=1 Tax=Ahaetulla prasina TaxID=499056 RepID=UPI002649D57F|nr:GRIP and coiled-coil domain-containing protein 2 [Ahaetulla prasina]